MILKPVIISSQLQIGSVVGVGQVAGACRGSLIRMGMEQAAVGQLHWSAANYAPFQERALWDGLIRMYDEVRFRTI